MSHAFPVSKGARLRNGRKSLAKEQPVHAAFRAQMHAGIIRGWWSYDVDVWEVEELDGTRTRLTYREAAKRAGTITTIPTGPAEARDTDPATSHAAAGSLDSDKLAGQRRTVFEQIAAAGEDGLTTAGLQQALTTADYRPERGTLARRCTDLRDAGLIVAADTVTSPATGRPVTVWVASRYAPATGNVGEEGAA